MRDHTPKFTQPQLPFDEIPFGYCHCGCGQKTNSAPHSNISRGWIKGQPIRYINGHGSRKYSRDVAPWVARYGLVAPYGECQCGCGGKTMLSNANSLQYDLAIREPRRFIKGHRIPTVRLGQRFGRLVITERSDQRINGHTAWICRCDCGNQVTCGCSRLTEGHTRSCGCLVTDTTTAKNKTHGMRQHQLYSTWCGIKQRCNDPNAINYLNYGGRGISICPEWQYDFSAFHDFVSLLPHYGEKGFSLDRIDNDGNYEPDNVQWATRREQRLNSRQPAKKT